MKPLARIIVRETAGIRRFLYPLECDVHTGDRGDFHAGIHVAPPGAGASWQVAKKDGTLVPTSSWPVVGQVYRDDIMLGDRSFLKVRFAVSLAPFEERELLLVETDDLSAIPDAMSLSFDEQDGLTTRQERVSFHLDARTGLDSVVYDGIQHLAGPLSITLDGVLVPVAGIVRGPRPDNPGLAAGFWWDAEAHATLYSLTACKSWVTVTHRINDPVADKTIRFSLSLRVVDEAPTCDFGVGNGVYEKIGGDAVMWTTEFGERPYAKWRVSTVNAGEERIDYQGEYDTPAEFEGRAWFHWIEKTKALAVAIPHVHTYCDRMVVTLSRNGAIDIAFTMSPNAPAGAHFSICYHFLNDIPAIAAATNPASILLPPTVEIQPLS